MRLKLLQRIFRVADRGRAAAGTEGRHINLATLPATIYAIGDVHGCLEQLRSLERKIFADSADIGGQKLLVMLGDYVDRGPNSAGVLDHLLAKPPPSFQRICLMGNHEVMASAYFDNPSPRSVWLEFGGRETLQSYGLTEGALAAARSTNRRDLIAAHVPAEHVEFLRTLPWTLSVPGWIFVHAGLRPGVPLTSQSPEDLFWIREEFFAAKEDTPERIVHGHTPAAEPVFTDHRICIDTGAYATGCLTALKITPDGRTAVIQSR